MFSILRKKQYLIINFPISFFHLSQTRIGPLGTWIDVVYCPFIKMAEIIINRKLLMRNLFKKIMERKLQELKEEISQENNDNLKLVV